jgi:hypothetical protein
MLRTFLINPLARASARALKLYELRPPKSFRVRIYTNAILLSVALRSRNYYECCSIFITSGVLP